MAEAKPNQVAPTVVPNGRLYIKKITHTIVITEYGVERSAEAGIVRVPLQVKKEEKADEDVHYPICSPGAVPGTINFTRMVIEQHNQTQPTMEQLAALFATMKNQPTDQK